ncbi:hypothetical protein BGC30_12625 [Novacetimonas hansenii]|nr:hypothetical protein BGC30_12625 [Novacetimonas hansenii]
MRNYFGDFRHTANICGGEAQDGEHERLVIRNGHDAQSYLVLILLSRLKAVFIISFGLIKINDGPFWQFRLDRTGNFQPVLGEGCHVERWAVFFRWKIIVIIAFRPREKLRAQSLADGEFVRTCRASVAMPNAFTTVFAHDADPFFVHE